MNKKMKFPTSYQGTTGTGFVIDLRDLSTSYPPTTKWNRCSWFRMRVNGTGGIYAIVPVIVADGDPAPSAPLAAPSDGATFINLKSGEPEWRVGLENSKGYDDSGQPLPESPTATHLQVFCVNQGTAAVFSVIAG